MNIKSIVKVESKEVLTCILLIIVGYMTAQFFMRRLNGFNVGAKTPEEIPMCTNADPATNGETILSTCEEAMVPGMGDCNNYVTISDGMIYKCKSDWGLCMQSDTACKIPITNCWDNSDGSHGAKITEVDTCPDAIIGSNKCWDYYTLNIAGDGFNRCSGDELCTSSDFKCTIPPLSEYCDNDAASQSCKSLQGPPGTNFGPCKHKQISEHYNTEQFCKTITAPGPISDKLCIPICNNGICNRKDYHDFTADGCTDKDVVNNKTNCNLGYNYDATNLSVQHLCKWDILTDTCGASDNLCYQNI
jgi:hypothetical protein